MIKMLTKAISAMRHGGSTRTPGWLLPRTRFDYAREVGDGLGTSVVTAPVQWVQRALPEARLMISKRDRNGKVEDMFDHAMLALIQSPNPYYGDIALWMATVLSLLTGGNAYWLVVRNGVGRPAELWYVPHWMMEPWWAPDGSTFVDHYRYTPGGGAGMMEIAPEDVVHFRHGIDPNNVRMGLSPIHGALREIFMDLESSNFVAALLRNMGVPGVVISPKGGTMPTPDDVEATKTWFTKAFSGDRRGAPLVMGAPTDVTPYGFNPQQMNMGEARDIAEERVCACLGIPAAVVGFGAGLQSTKVGATMQEMRKLAWHNGVLPVCRLIADELQRSLLPLFGKADGMTVGWDTSQVLALQDDEDKETERWSKRVTGGWAMVAEARAACGMDVDDSHRIYLRPINLIEVPAGPAPRKQAALSTGVLALPGNARRGVKQGQASAAQLARGERYAEMAQRARARLTDAFEPRLRELFTSWGKEAGEAARPILAAALPKAAKSDEQLVAQILAMLRLDAWRGDLERLYGAHYEAVANAVSDVAETSGLGARLDDPVSRAIIAAGGKRVGLIDIDAQTREAIFDALAEGQAANESTDELAARIAGQVEGGRWRTAETRARVIAITETAYADNMATIAQARAAGADGMMVFDGRYGPGRSIPSHIARNGTIVGFEEAESMTEAEHPRGTLNFAPWYNEDEL